MNSPAPATIPAPPKRTQGEGPVGRAITLCGVGAAAVFMILSIVKSSGAPISRTTHSFQHLILRKELAEGRPEAYAAAACLLLVVTPMLRLSWITIMLATSGRRGFALAALAVVCILATSFLYLYFS